MLQFGYVTRVGDEAVTVRVDQLNKDVVVYQYCYNTLFIKTIETRLNFPIYSCYWGYPPSVIDVKTGDTCLLHIFEGQVINWTVIPSSLIQKYRKYIDLFAPLYRTFILKLNDIVIFKPESKIIASHFSDSEDEPKTAFSVTNNNHLWVTWVLDPESGNWSVCQV